MKSSSPNPDENVADGTKSYDNHVTSYVCATTATRRYAALRFLFLLHFRLVLKQCFVTLNVCRNNTLIIYNQGLVVNILVVGLNTVHSQGIDLARFKTRQDSGRFWTLSIYKIVKKHIIKVHLPQSVSTTAGAIVNLYYRTKSTFPQS